MRSGQSQAWEVGLPVVTGPLLSDVCGGEGRAESDHRAELPHRVTAWASRSRNRMPGLEMEGGTQARLQANLGVAPV